MRRQVMAAAASLLLASCGGGSANNGADGGNAAGNQGAPSNSSDAQNKVRALDQGQRDGLLIRAIRDAQQECQHVERSDLVQTSNNVLTYMVGCRGGYEYVVVIRDDGVAIVQPAMREEGQ